MSGTLPEDCIRKCTKCRREKPENADNFAPVPRRPGCFEACCRECRNQQSSRRKSRSRGDYLTGIVDTRRGVLTAFRKRDPDGSEMNELRAKLQAIAGRFRDMALLARVDTLAWFTREFLGQPEERR